MRPSFQRVGQARSKPSASGQLRASGALVEIGTRVSTAKSVASGMFAGPFARTRTGPARASSNAPAGAWRGQRPRLRPRRWIAAREGRVARVRVFSKKLFGCGGALLAAGPQDGDSAGARHWTGVPRLKRGRGMISPGHANQATRSPGEGTTTRCGGCGMDMATRVATTGTPVYTHGALRAVAGGVASRRGAGTGMALQEGPRCSTLRRGATGGSSEWTRRRGFRNPAGRAGIRTWVTRPPQAFDVKASEGPDVPYARGQA